jgi:hypothetical protein
MHGCMPIQPSQRKSFEFICIKDSFKYSRAQRQCRAMHYIKLQLCRGLCWGAFCNCALVSYPTHCSDISTAAQDLHIREACSMKQYLKISKNPKVAANAGYGYGRLQSIAGGCLLLVVLKANASIIFTPSILNSECPPAEYCGSSTAVFTGAVRSWYLISQTKKTVSTAAVIEYGRTALGMAACFHTLPFQLSKRRLE